MAWTEIPGDMVTSLPVSGTVSRDGVVHVFAVGTDKCIYFNNRTAGGEWAGWTKYPVAAQTNCAVAVTRDHLDRVVVLHTGLDGKIYQSQQTSAAWTSWAVVDSSGGSTSLAVSAAGADRHFHWFHVGTDKRVYTIGMTFLVAE